MINTMLLKQIKKYNPKNINEIKNSMKEVLQDIILAGLGKSDFFKYAVFYGGTSLRIFRKLPRFSEDLDFTLYGDVDDINFKEYLMYSKKELDSMGINCEIYEKEKKINTSVESNYFRFNMKYLFEITYPEYANMIINNEILSIKVELEKETFDGGQTELLLLTYPSLVQVRTFKIETLFASKLVAVLNRKWKSRIKGRDFYDYLFYVTNKTKVNLLFLENGLKKFGFLREDEVLSIERLKEELRVKFNNVNYDDARLDVLPFVENNDSFINSFNKEIFVATIDLIN